MHTGLKMAGYALGLAAIFGTAVGIGAAVGPDATVAEAVAGSHSADVEPAADAMTKTAMAAESELPGGLMVSQDGFTLALADRSIPAGSGAPVRFQILGPDGTPVIGYETKHDKDLHLIVVRRDFTGFQHVHPILAQDGTWSALVDLSAPGEYRVFADFTADGHDGGVTLGADLAVSGVYDPRPLPAPVATADAGDGYQVTMAGQLVAGQNAELTLDINKDGAAVTDLQPYLAAYGHLVALRAGDLAYLHVHPAGEPGDGVTPAGPGITFYATAPSAGDYRLYLNFQHNGVVRTAEFTLPATLGAPATTVAPVEPETDGHGH